MSFVLMRGDHVYDDIGQVAHEQIKQCDVSKLLCCPTNKATPPHIRKKNDPKQWVQQG